MREPAQRIRKAGAETLKSGKIAKNPQRMGPLTFEARLHALETVLDIQRQVNEEADRRGRPRLDLINAVEEARIRELIALKTWPDGWTGDEPSTAVWR